MNTDWLHLVLLGSPDDQAIEHLRRGFEVWLRSAQRARRGSDGVLRRQRHLSLARCLGLPENPLNARLEIRNVYLRRAAAHIPATDSCTAWQRARGLAQEIARFRGHLYPCWYNLTAPPTNASDLDRLLFLAARNGGGSLPSTARQLHKILSE